MTALAERERRHQLEAVVGELRAAALEAGTELPVVYAEQIALDGLTLCDQLGVTPLGNGVILHTAPEGTRDLPKLLGYADGSGQWYRDSTKYLAEQPERRPAVTKEAGA
jgi:hypothetical protein